MIHMVYNLEYKNQEPFKPGMSRSMVSITKPLSLLFYISIKLFVCSSANP